MEIIYFYNHHIKERYSSNICSKIQLILLCFSTKGDSDSIKRKLHVNLKLSIKIS